MQIVVTLFPSLLFPFVSFTITHLVRIYLSRPLPMVSFNLKRTILLITSQMTRSDLWRHNSFKTALFLENGAVSPVHLLLSDSADHSRCWGQGKQHYFSKQNVIKYAKSMQCDSTMKSKKIKVYCSPRTQNFNYINWMQILSAQSGVKFFFCLPLGRPGKQMNVYIRGFFDGKRGTVPRTKMTTWWRTRFLAVPLAAVMHERFSFDTWPTMPEENRVAIGYRVRYS